ncbi:MAG: hypothetical protein F6J95_019995 [Leptolyngbya sp. SIO1E4]|nr:hypothetical protein [Leptolyngbya sp. SIO1E4]
MKIIQSATATNQSESNSQDLYQILEDVNIWHIAGGSVWSVGSQNQNSGSHQGRHDTGGYVPTT